LLLIVRVRFETLVFGNVAELLEEKPELSIDHVILNVR